MVLALCCTYAVPVMYPCCDIAVTDWCLHSEWCDQCPNGVANACVSSPTAGSPTGGSGAVWNDHSGGDCGQRRRHRNLARRLLHKDQIVSIPPPARTHTTHTTRRSPSSKSASPRPQSQNNAYVLYASLEGTLEINGEITRNPWHCQRQKPQKPKKKKNSPRVAVSVA